MAPRWCCPDQGALVLESSTAAGPADELLQHVAVNLPEGGRLRHLCQVVHAELEAELFQVLHVDTQIQYTCTAHTQHTESLCCS